MNKRFNDMCTSHHHKLCFQLLITPTSSSSRNSTNFQCQHHQSNCTTKQCASRLKLISSQDTIYSIDSVPSGSSKITFQSIKIPSMEISPNHTPNHKPKSPIRRLFLSKVKSPVKRRHNVSGNEVERVFQYIDENGDGKISPAELQSCIKAVAGGTTEVLTDEEAEAAVRNSNSDGDGYLSLEDLEKIMAAKELPEEERTAELREAFAMYEETTGSGRITARSLKRMMSRLGESNSVRDCQTMISKYDLNGDGVISFEEFAAMMR